MLRDRVHSWRTRNLIAIGRMAEQKLGTKTGGLQAHPRMINSILERPKRCIILDHIIIQNTEDIQIITNPSEILTKVAQHYKEWIPYRQTKPL